MEEIMDSQADAAIDIDAAVEELTQPEAEGELPETDNNEPEAEASDNETEAETQEPEDSDESEEAESFESIYEIAEALNMPVDEFLSTVKAKRKVNGQEEEVPLSELIAGNQRETDYRQKTMELAEQRKQFDTFAQQSQAQYQAQLQQAYTMSQMIEHQLLENYNDIDWQSLERNDREEWLVMRQKFQEDYAKVQQVKNTAQQSLQQQNQKQLQENEQRRKQYLEQQEQLLLSSIPDWQNADTRLNETKQISSLLSDYGYSQIEIANASDHRMVRILHDLVKARSGQQRAEIATKKVKQLPKITKPGAKVKTNKRKQSLDRLSKTGRIEDALDLIMVND